MLRLTLAATFTLFVAVGLLSAIEGRPPGELAREAGPEAEDPAAPGGAVEVTRAAGFSAIAPAQSPVAAPLPEPAAEPDPAPAPEAAPEAEMAAMTAGIVANLSRATGAAEPEPEPAGAPAPVSRELDALTQAVLTSLGAPAAPSAAPSPGAAPRRDLSSLISQAMQAGEGDAYVAALLEEANGAAPEAAPPAPQDLSGLIRAALAHEGSDAYIDALLNEAASAGRIEVPAALRTADGRFDTRTLIADLVQKSAGTPAPVRAPTLENSGGVEGVEVRVVQQVDTARDALFYTVQEGDSLGAIAQRFYGNASLYLEIFEANRQTLSSPDRIRIGQRLRLPEVSA